MSATIIDGREFARRIQSQLATEVALLKTKNIEPSLAVLLIGDDPASAIYVSKKREACQSIGIGSEIIHLPKNVSQREVEKTIDQLNFSVSCSGILIQLPLPHHLDRLAILNKVYDYKDVDGFHHHNLGKLAQGEPIFVPCTPLAIHALIRHYQIPLQGRHVVIVNDTIVVGKPLAMLLQMYGATVTLCNHYTKNIREICQSGDIVVFAVGKRPNFVADSDFIREGVAVFDIGVNKVDGKIFGDVNFDEVKEKAGWISPVIGGIGPCTVAMLLKNTVKAAELAWFKSW